MQHALTEAAMCCRYETLTALLEGNELGTVSEFNVFLAAMRWVEADDSREQLLDEVLGLIRFPTMDYEELGLVGKHPTAAGAAILKVESTFICMYCSLFTFTSLQRPKRGVTE